MHASTHTVELDPAVTWRLVGVGGTERSRREAPADVGPVDVVPEAEPLAAATAPLSARRAWSRTSLGDALELGCFTATLAAIAVLELSLFALLA